MQRRQRRILIVDDEENQTFALQAALKKLPDCQTVSAHSGDEALAELGRQPYDLLITDYHMPGMNGLALAARARRLYPSMPIIMLTAFGDEVLRQVVSRDWINRLLDKPVHLNEIRDAVQSMLQMGQGNTPSNGSFIS